MVHAETNERGTNRRFIVESKNRDKELKCDLSMDRLSDHRFVANYFRLYLYVTAINLVIRARARVTLTQRAARGQIRARGELLSEFSRFRFDVVRSRGRVDRVEVELRGLSRG